MTTQALGPRLAVIVSQALGVPVTFSRWIFKTNGDVPVFAVAHLTDEIRIAADALLLHVEEAQ